MRSIPFSDKLFQEQDDARTLARAEEIKADGKRKAGAIRGAKVITREKVKELAGLRRVVRKAPVKRK